MVDDVTTVSVVLPLSGKVGVCVGVVAIAQLVVPGAFAPGQGLNWPTISPGKSKVFPGSCSRNGPDPTPRKGKLLKSNRKLIQESSSSEGRLTEWKHLITKYKKLRKFEEEHRLNVNTRFYPIGIGRCPGK